MYIGAAMIRTLPAKFYYQLRYQTKDNYWVTDRSPFRTYSTKKQAKAAIEFMVDKKGIKIVRIKSVA
jgi:hypothetical protein